MTIKVAIDAMGGDHGLSVTVPASIDALQKFSDLHITLVGKKQLIESELANHQYDTSRLTIEHAEQVVEMDDLPSKALRNKRQSSMRIALNLVKDDQAQACVSAGNTGALMAVAKFVLKTLPGIERPAICTSMPTMKGHVHVLDLGANVGCTGENLAQFAVMGSVLAKAVDDNPHPRVGLLNIGEEEIKGHQRIKDAHQIISGSKINYIGYVEGDDIYKGDTDVVACDGFDGNIALKSSEGVAKMIAFYLREAFNRNLLTKFIGLCAYPVLKSFKDKVDPRRYNGASLLGLRKIVIKSHGGADRFSFYHAIAEARLEVIKNVPDLISEEVSQLLVAPPVDDAQQAS
ncbi:MULTISPECIES: phosphate acyltransferase PlsX [Thiomicrorhabdus]|uniref:Phosphate acyltransferase n=1 Tax=Thiomicrorhabdus heinhorstiae TaxID=2748010 RepID=A0ABS0BZL5_9GAMM|nr:MULTISPECIES: phosphate acyltransferase PlsX [Thiomicrorhabdus]MBF6058523.1 phosphate acyltransferase PlsX [Thiomicrorhabdus heinhorstiae]